MTNESSEPGRLLSGRYRLTELIGEGGMGRVWEGVDEVLDRSVAVKELLIPPQLPSAEVEVLRTRMLREARHAAQLSHPSIITVFDVVEIDERPWIVMELVRGPSLGSLIKSGGAFEPQRAAGIGAQVAAGLSLAHERGIVHRDIKPANVLIARGDRAVLTDFGIAHLEGSSHLTRTGLLVGSPSYLAPEQAHGRPATPASDIWALGVTLYQAVEGTTPFHRDTPMATLTAIVTAEVPQPKSAGELAPVLERLLQKDAGDRPSVDEAASLLQAAAEEAHGERDSAASAGRRDDAAQHAPVGAALHVAHSPQASGASPAGGNGGGAAPASAAPPGPIPAAGQSAPERGGRRGGAALAIAGGLVALVLVAGAVAWIGSRQGAPAEEAGAVGDSAAPSAGSSEEGQNGSGQEGTQAAPDSDAQDGGQPEEDEGGGDDRPELPEMSEHEDPTGFSVEIPEDWPLDNRSGTSVFFDIPGEPGYLQVDQSDDPADDAKDDWVAQEPRMSANFDGYSLVGIEALGEPYTDDYISAADWEFTFTGQDGTAMHAVDRAFHTEEKGYALFLVSTEASFARNKAILDEAAESFEPAG
ncbi:serine/threonine-protein kinase [Streptomonospora wellingtoniae]|uniref:non-specific serine/threonine protein kinase n=1 Tax=Streptomonospora wellingtoniae TaxID=3075544 RepID=A0ABU2KNF2_9ACTN|nr:protein kinase [Streptomonospora sp. DSM 45055]MDT0300799.1 protein kinase [Streptomonospora sp. DSM 45055]